MGKKQIRFMALGGAQRVGASCYYLGLGDSHILLDCGIGQLSGMRLNPVINSLLGIPGIYSFRQIMEVYISHAHLDHSGYLPELFKQSTECRAYMTEITRRLLHHQYSTEGYAKMMHYKRSYTSSMLENVFLRSASVSYCNKMPFNEYSVEFLQAGHIPGAMMMLFSYAGKNILYTGDFSINGSILTEGCMLPDKEIDLMIMCGLHAKHPLKHKSVDVFEVFCAEVSDYLSMEENVYCQTAQLSKGVELLKFLNSFVPPFIKIYVDPYIYGVVRELERLNVQIFQRNNYLLSENSDLSAQHIILSTRRQSGYFSQYAHVDGNFSLHDSFEETLHFIKQINSRDAVIIHSPGNLDGSVETVEQRLVFDPDCRTQFLFPEEQELYVF